MKHKFTINIWRGIIIALVGTVVANMSATESGSGVKFIDFPSDDIVRSNIRYFSPDMYINGDIIRICTEDGLYARDIKDSEWQCHLNGMQVGSFVYNGEKLLCATVSDTNKFTLFNVFEDGTADDISLDPCVFSDSMEVCRVYGNPFYPNVVYAVRKVGKVLVSCDFGETWDVLKSNLLSRDRTSCFHPYILGLYFDTIYYDFGNQVVEYAWGDGRREALYYQYNLIGTDKTEYLLSSRDQIKQFAFCESDLEKVWFCGNGFVGYFTISEIPLYESGYSGISYPCDKSESAAGVVVDAYNSDIVYFPTVKHEDNNESSTLSIYVTKDGCKSWERIVNHDLGKYSGNLVSVKESKGIIYMLTDEYCLLSCEISHLASVDNPNKVEIENAFTIGVDNSKVICKTSEPGVLSFYSTVGSLLECRNIVESEIVIEQLSPGIYIYRFVNDNGNMERSGKLMVR